MPWSCMKRMTRMAKRCAGEMTPYGKFSAASPETAEPGGAAPKRWNCPCASERKTTTQSAMPPATAAVALPTAAEPPPPPPPHCILENRNAGGIVAVVAVRGEAVDLTRLDARVGAGAEDGLECQGELRVRRLPVLVVRGLPDASDGGLA